MRPRERYALCGPETFNDDELLALVIGLGTPRTTALEMGRALLARLGGLAQVADAPVEALCAVPGIGEARAVRLHAALHAGQRAARERPAERRPLSTPHDAWQLMRPQLEGLPHEELHGLYLDRRKQPIALRVLTRGSDGSTVVEPRQVFRPAVQCSAAAVIVAHNHPSGDPTPSAADRDVTRRLASSATVLGIVLIDHLILGDGCFCSLAEEGVLASWTERALPGSTG